MPRRARSYHLWEDKGRQVTQRAGIFIIGVVGGILFLSGLLKVVYLGASMLDSRTPSREKVEGMEVEEIGNGSSEDKEERTYNYTGEFPIMWRCLQMLIGLSMLGTALVLARRSNDPGRVYRQDIEGSGAHVTFHTAGHAPSHSSWTPAGPCRAFSGQGTGYGLCEVPGVAGLDKTIGSPAFPVAYVTPGSGWSGPANHTPAKY